MTKCNLTTIQEFYYQRCKELCDHAFEFTGTLPQALEIVNEAVIEACMKHEEIGTIDKLLPFLLRKIEENWEVISREMERLNKVKDVVYAEQRTKKCSFTHSQITLEVLRATYEEIDKLKSLRKHILNLTFHGYSIEQIADFVGRDTKTVLTERKRAIRQLQVAICKRGLL